MAHKTFLPEALQDYILDHWLREPDILRRLREETATHPQAGYQIPPDQGQLMGLLAKLCGAKNLLEIGVFTGYSALSVMLAVDPQARLTALDISEEFTSVARRYWAEAGVADRIDLRIGAAIDTLDTISPKAPFDFVFIDADKSNYDAYYEKVLPLVAVGGVMLFDNVLWHGQLTDLEDQEPDTIALRNLNSKLRTDERVDLALIPIADGMTLLRKR